MASENSIASLPAADAHTLSRIAGCESVDLLLPDTNGVLRGKRVTAEALGKVYREGVCLPMSLIATDITGNTVEETGLGYAIGDADRICRPIEGSLRPVPWAPRPMAQLLLAMHTPEGALFEVAPRAVLQRVLQGFGALGLNPVIAVELEFYLFDAIADAQGRPQTPRDPITGERSDSTQVYSLQDLDDQRGFTDAVTAACRQQGIPADTAVAEYAPGQFEINLHHRADAVAACDEAILLKRTIKAIAQQQGKLASFMAKPFPGQAGSGLHLHVSLLDAAGHNVLASAADAPAQPLRHAIAGLQRHADASLLMFAPHANSYRRFVSNAFVPLDASWGFNNRTVALRIPHSDAHNTRIEHRIAGADANPYLAAAAVLAGMLDGLRQPAEPTAAVTGNAYAQSVSTPRSWQGAVDAFLGSDFIAEQFGTRFQHVFGQQKQRELLDYQAQVPDLDYARYLRTV
ncbi:MULTISPECIES: glutamine synthetase family protein [Xanthomonas]|uniref:glutamine synthetase family protein n=1 Tax=Xanthomonas TaxID=338 RepID=UPI001C45E21F|nr:glutamine synthetase family protein [Xanthomonas euvesicatoria]MBV6669674.1 glutamine synthetase family protein [Xanthomonas euvesicatoria pv. alangii]MBV6789385.1 glutamine synthetase family protein [Xanthomonas campestris pv. clerodendri]MCC8912164.1 glutamine synthetase family protein [Xanthomonas euvesicatoria]MCP3034520.1 glutamine synthetase family protein [Xanthomonas euvesicatoria pv. allii]